MNSEAILLFCYLFKSKKEKKENWELSEKKNSMNQKKKKNVLLEW